MAKAKVTDRRASNAHGPPDEPERCHAFRPVPGAGPFVRASEKMKRCERGAMPGEAFCGLHPGDADHDSSSYFTSAADQGNAWRCPLTPRQFDDAIMQAEGLRSGTLARARPVDTTTRSSDGGACDCTTSGLPPGAVHSVRCATRFKAQPAPKPGSPGAGPDGTFRWSGVRRGSL